MRKLIAILACAGLGGVLYLAGCYSVGDLGDAPFKCTQDVPDCPAGYHCQLDTGPRQNFCIRDTSNGSTKMPVSIPKSAMFPGVHPEPNIDPTTCMDNGNEPNDNFAQAVPLDTGLLMGRAICPAGDVDYYRGTASAEFVRVTINYNVVAGDLDLAFLDGTTGAVKSTTGQFDGSAKSNGCISSGNTKFTGDVWIAVTGANDVDQAPYTIKLDHGTSQLPCTGATDGGI